MGQVQRLSLANIPTIIPTIIITTMPMMAVKNQGAGIDSPGLENYLIAKTADNLRSIFGLSLP